MQISMSKEIDLGIKIFHQRSQDEIALLNSTKDLKNYYNPQVSRTQK